MRLKTRMLKREPAYFTDLGETHIYSYIVHRLDCSYDSGKVQPLYNFDLLLIYSILFTQVPIPSSPTSTTSPSLSHNGGFLPIPTPCGLTKIISCNESPSRSIHSRSCKNQISRKKGRPLTQKANCLCYPKDHILGTTVLDCFAVNLGGNLKGLWIFDQSTRYNAWPIRSPPILRILELA